MQKSSNIEPKITYLEIFRLKTEQAIAIPEVIPEVSFKSKKTLYLRPKMRNVRFFGSQL